MNGARRRFFFALIPGRRERATLARWARDTAAAVDGRAMRADSLHLTLAFVGDVAADTEAALRDAGAATAFVPFELTLDVLDAFRAKRIVWAGTSASPPALAALAAGLRARLAERDVAVDPQPFVAHVTLVRNAVRAAGWPRVAALRWPVDGFELIESVPLDGRREYRVRARWPDG